MAVHRWRRWIRQRRRRARRCPTNGARQVFDALWVGRVLEGVGPRARARSRPPTACRRCQASGLTEAAGLKQMSFDTGALEALSDRRDHRRERCRRRSNSGRRQRDKRLNAGSRLQVMKARRGQAANPAQARRRPLEAPAVRLEPRQRSVEFWTLDGFAVIGGRLRPVGVIGLSDPGGATQRLTGAPAPASYSRFAAGRVFWLPG